MELSEWLADINNEREEKNETYSYHLSSLEKFVMIKFSNETTVVPPESSVRKPSRSMNGEIGVLMVSGLGSIILRVGRVLRWRNGISTRRIGLD